MGDLSENFSRSEFECNCGCGLSEPSRELIFLLEQVRLEFNAPVTINSAHRCPTHNKAVGGALKSQHLYGTAADIVVKDVPPARIYEFLNEFMFNFGGVGKYNTFTHIDVRIKKARW